MQGPWVFFSPKFSWLNPRVTGRNMQGGEFSSDLPTETPYFDQTKVSKLHPLLQIFCENLKALVLKP